MKDKIMFPSWSITFDLECDEKMTEFLKRTYEEQMALDEAIRERINKLFDRYIGYDSEKARNVGVQIFAIGYQLGYNDCHNVLDKEKQYEK
jgi:hypothetical protein